MKIKRLPSPIQRMNVPLKSVARTIKEWMNEDDLQLNPDFQRGHVWTPAQQTDYLEWVLVGGQSGLDIWFNHPGWMTDFKGSFVCIDGLQRLTAIMQFLDNKLSPFGHPRSEIEFAYSDYSLFFNVMNMQTRKETLEWYLTFNKKGTPHTQAELNRIQKLVENCP